MMKSKTYFIILVSVILTSAPSVSGQQPGTETTLKNLFLDILDSRNDSVRIRKNDSINLIIEKYISSGIIFSHRFENLRYLGQILSPDAKVKIVTWNLILTDGTNKYFCYIIKKGEKGDENKIFRLQGANLKEAPVNDITYTRDNWYGALYYGIQPFRVGKETYYMVLGLDYGSLYVSRKIIDVISFPMDKLIFGKNCLQKDGELKLREVFEYSADGVMTLRFHNKKTIIFDHLTAISGGNKYDSGSYGSEFSYDAYVYKKGLWKFVRNIDVRNKQ